MPQPKIPSRRRFLRGFLLPACLAVAALPALPSPGQSRADGGSPQEYEVKAAFLYNFTKFVTWPSDAFGKPEAPFVIGVLGKDPFGATLDRTFNGRKLNGRGFVIRRLRSEDDARDCHLLFIAASAGSAAADRAIRAVRDRPVLTVGDQASVAASGGVVGFVIEDNRVRFEINQDAARRANLSVAAQLMRLARVARPRS